MQPNLTALLADMRARSWCVTVDGKPVYFQSKSAVAEFTARVKRVHARDGMTEPAIVVTAPQIAA